MSAKDFKTLNEQVATIQSAFKEFGTSLENIATQLKNIEEKQTTIDTRLENLEKIIPGVTDSITERLNIVEQTAPVKNSIDLAEFTNLKKAWQTAIPTLDKFNNPNIRHYHLSYQHFIPH